MGHPRSRFASACHDSLFCRGRPASVPLRHTIARSVLATPHSRKWLDGVSDARASAVDITTQRQSTETNVRLALLACNDTNA